MVIITIIAVPIWSFQSVQHLLNKSICLKNRECWCVCVCVCKIVISFSDQANH